MRTRVQTTTMSGWLALLRTLTLYGVRAAVTRAAPLYATVAIVSAIIFGGNGMHPRHLTQLAVNHAGPRIALWAAWIVASAPVARVLLNVPETVALRALPAPRVLLWGAPLVHLLVAEWPWALLWGIGEGWPWGIACAAVAAAAHSLLVARLIQARDFALATVLIAVIAAPMPAVALLAVGLIAAPLATETAWRRAPEARDRARSGRPLWMRSSWLAIGEVELRAAWRAERNVFARGGVILLLAAAAAALGIRNNHVSSMTTVARVALGVLVAPACAALGGIASAVARAERRQSWVLASLGCVERDRMFAALAAVLATSAGLGATYGGLVAAFASATISQSVRLIGGGALAAASVGVIATVAVRLAGEGPAANDRIIVLLLSSAIVGTVAASLWGEPGAIFVAAVAIVAFLLVSRIQRRAKLVEAP